MTIDLDRLRAAKAKADGSEKDRDNYAAYVAERVENGGWSDADVAEYREEVGRIMKSGTADEKVAAREFWAHKVKNMGPERGINARIRAQIERDAA